MSPQAEVVTTRLRKTWLQWWTFSFWSGAILAAAVSLATLVLFVLVDALLKLPQRALVSLFAVWAVLSLAAVAALLVRQQRGRRSLAATARRVELAFPELESHLINLVQFAGRDGLETDPFRQAAITQSAAAVADFPFDQAATRENRWRRFPRSGGRKPRISSRATSNTADTAPAGWDPLPHDATWVVEKGKDAKAGNRIIRFTMNEDVAGSTGVLYYSNFFPVEEGATYRFQCRWRTTGSAAKVFIKCYDELPTSFRTREGGDSLKTEKREVYRSQQNLQGSAGAWNVQTEDFTPQHTQFTPRWGRVMLYAYWPAGSVEWDDVVVKQIAPAPPRKREKDRRPSTETKVRTREMQEDPAAPAQPAPARKKPGRKGRVEARVQIDRAWH